MNSPTKILIVDDHPGNIQALSELIASDAIEIHSALDAERALELLVKHDFALALLDVQMPVTSGFELARLIRGVKKFKHLPIIFVTAQREERGFVFEGYDTGAVDLLFKPLDPFVVRSKVQVFVQLDQQKKLLHQQVDELERLRVEADSANLAKSRFLANMSHEIRTPLAAVMGFSEMLAKGQYLPEEKEECTSAIRRNGQLLLRLIDDILDISKIEAQRLEFEKTDFALDDVLRDVDSTLSLRAAEKGIGLRIELMGGSAAHYRADATRIKQVLLNVIGNAIKFTSHGRVEVVAKVESESESQDRLVATIRDSGIGMTQEQADRLFQPFTQADASTRRQFGGTGLGLVISRQIARGMGGDLRLVHSVEKQGSTFEISLLMDHVAGPIERRSEPRVMASAEKAQRSPFEGKRILAIDDCPDNLTLIEMYLRTSGAQVTYAESGPEALEILKSEQPDLILMDIQMPGMDGHEATHRIREMGYEKPIIALTAHATRAEQERCLKSGCTAVLTKPIHRMQFLDGVQKHLFQ